MEEQNAYVQLIKSLGVNSKQVKAAIEGSQNGLNAEERARIKKSKKEQQGDSEMEHYLRNVCS